MISRSLALLGLLASCAAPPSAPESPEVPPSEAARPDVVEAVLGARAHLAPAPVDGDPDRVIVLDEPLGDLPAGYRLLEAHRVGDGLLILQTNHELWWRAEGQARRIEREVEAPLSVRGRQVAFARGEMPDFEIVTYDLDADFVRPLTEGFAPTWNPALGPSGDVIFVSGRDGTPALYRVRPGEAPRRLLDDGAFPSWIEAPIHDGVTLRYRDHDGVEHAIAITYAPDVPTIDDATTGATR
ncbi:MAG: hypothetical protein H6722_18990 [Sandaracinus sp.]|nr:hypothetical protein [Sandaracinus sp.]MCB9622936.1 hypothetical protein [Sandaracinus sp.]